MFLHLAPIGKSIGIAPRVLGQRTGQSCLRFPVEQSSSGISHRRPPPVHALLHVLHAPKLLYSRLLNGPLEWVGLSGHGGGGAILGSKRPENGVSSRCTRRLLRIGRTLSLRIRNTVGSSSMSNGCEHSACRLQNKSEIASTFHHWVPPYLVIMLIPPSYCCSCTSHCIILKGLRIMQVSVQFPRDPSKTC